jgi:hypothetical protein
MSIFRSYFVDSLGISIGGTSATPALYIAAASAADLNIARLKVEIEAASSPAPPSNGSVLFQLSLVTGTVGGGGSVTAEPTGQSTLAAQTTFTSAHSAAITGLTQSTTYWQSVVPFTAGAWAEDTFENTGFEINIPHSGIYAVYFTAASGAGSGCNARVGLWFAE